MHQNVERAAIGTGACAQRARSLRFPKSVPGLRRRAFQDRQTIRLRLRHLPRLRRNRGHQNRVSTEPLTSASTCAVGGRSVGPLLRLDPPLPLMTPRGDAMAHFVIRDGAEHHLRWVVFIIETGECWTFLNPDVRLWTNITEGRAKVTPFKHGR